MTQSESVGNAHSGYSPSESIGNGSHTIGCSHEPKISGDRNGGLLAKVSQLEQEINMLKSEITEIKKVIYGDKPTSFPISRSVSTGYHIS